MQKAEQKKPGHTAKAKVKISGDRKTESLDVLFERMPDSWAIHKIGDRLVLRDDQNFSRYGQSHLAPFKESSLGHFVADCLSFMLPIWRKEADLQHEQEQLRKEMREAQAKLDSLRRRRSVEVDKYGTAKFHEDENEYQDDEDEDSDG